MDGGGRDAFPAVSRNAHHGHAARVARGARETSIVAADSDEHPAQILRYVARFDRREYWLAHEELEELWLIDRRDFFKGLIQVAAAFLHVERQNWRGARRPMKTSLQYLAAVPGIGRAHV